MMIDKKFFAIAKKHDLENKAAVHRFQNGNSLSWTIYRIIKNEQERKNPLPEKFIMELEEKLVPVERKRRKNKGGTFYLMVSSSGKTMKEIREHQFVWN